VTRAIRFSQTHKQLSVDVEYEPHFNCRMRIVLLIFVCLAFCGCSGKRKSAHDDAAFAGLPEESGKKKLIVTVENGLTGKVALVNTTDRFVVLDFPLGKLPKIDQRLSLYRGGLKVGEVRVTGPQYDDNVVADLIAGDSEIGDQVRDK
jgi:hypothetical protein